MQDVYYYPYGGIRWSRDGGTTPSPASATRRTYTGQYDIGFWAGAIQHYNARQYDDVLGRFLQPDTVTADPGNPYDLNRYMYSLSKERLSSGRWTKRLIPGLAIMVLVVIAVPGSLLLDQWVCLPQACCGAVDYEISGCAPQCCPSRDVHPGANACLETARQIGAGRPVSGKLVMCVACLTRLSVRP